MRQTLQTTMILLYICQIYACLGHFKVLEVHTSCSSMLTAEAPSGSLCRSRCFCIYLEVLNSFNVISISSYPQVLAAAWQTTLCKSIIKTNKFTKIHPQVTNRRPNEKASLFTSYIWRAAHFLLLQFSLFVLVLFNIRGKQKWVLIIQKSNKDTSVLFIPHFGRTRQKFHWFVLTAGCKSSEAVKD